MNYLQYFVERFGRTTFVGFLIASALVYAKPEIQNTILLMYGVLGGRNAIEVYKTKGTQTNDKAGGS
jgi:hypothetical protein